MRMPKRTARHIELERWLSFLLDEKPHLNPINAVLFRATGASMEQVRLYR